jgi:putative lipoic acid-binding regulatory protein
MNLEVNGVEKSMDIPKFKSLLDEQMTWPDYYTFKFVVKVNQKNQALELLEGHKTESKESKNGNFVSITSRKLMHSSEDVVAVYSMMSKVEGIMSL